MVFPSPIVINNFHAETLRPNLGHPATDSPEAQDAKRLPLKFYSEKKFRLPSLVFALSHKSVGFNQSSGDGRKERESMFCNRLGRHPGRVSHCYPHFSCGCQINVV